MVAVTALLQGISAIDVVQLLDVITGIDGMDATPSADGGSIFVEVGGPSDAQRLVDMGPLPFGKGTITFSMHRTNGVTMESVGVNSSGGSRRSYPVMCHGLDDCPQRDRLLAYLQAQHQLSALPIFVDGFVDCFSVKDANTLLQTRGGVHFGGYRVQFYHPSLMIEFGGAALDLYKRKGTNGFTAFQLRGQVVPPMESEATLTFHAEDAEAYDVIMQQCTISLGVLTITVSPKLYPELPSSRAIESVRCGKLASASEISSLLVVHDAENCFLPPDDLSWMSVMNSVQEIVLTCTQEGATLAGLRLIGGRCRWLFVLPEGRDGSFTPNTAVRDEVKTRSTFTAVGNKRGSVDVKIKDEMALYGTQQGGKGGVLVLIAGDGDYVTDLDNLRRADVLTILIHAGNINRLATIETAAGFAFNAWGTIINRAKAAVRRPIRPPSLDGSRAGGGGGPIGDANRVLVMVSAHVFRYVHLHSGTIHERLLAKLEACLPDAPPEVASLFTVSAQRPEKQKSFCCIELKDAAAADPVRAKIEELAQAYMLRLRNGLEIVTLPGVSKEEVKKHGMIHSFELQDRVSAYVPQRDALGGTGEGVGRGGGRASGRGSPGGRLGRGTGRGREGRGREGRGTGQDEGTKRDGNASPPPSADVLLVSDIDADPNATQRIKELLQSLIKATTTVTIRDTPQARFALLNLLHLQREARARFDATLAMLRDSRDITLTCQTTVLQEAARWLTDIVNNYATETVDVSNKPEEVRKAMAAMAYRKTVADVKSMEQQDDDDSSDDDDDASSQGGGAAAGGVGQRSKGQVVGIYAWTRGITVVGPRPHVDIGRANVQALLAELRNESVRLDSAAVAKRNLASPQAQTGFVKKHSLIWLAYNAANREVEMWGHNDDVASALEDLTNGVNTTLYCVLPPDGPPVHKIFGGAAFQRQLKASLARLDMQPSNMRVNMSYQDVKKKKKVILIRGPKQAAEAYHKKAQDALDKLCSTVVELSWDLPQYKEKYLRQRKGDIARITRTHGTTLVFQPQGRSSSSLPDMPPSLRNTVGQWSFSLPAPADSAPKSLHVEVVQCCLEHVGAEFIVNPANGQLAHHAGLAAALCRLGGQQVKEESVSIIARRGGPIPVGDVELTSAGSLAGVRRIVHAVVPTLDVPNRKSVLCALVGKCLDIAGAQGAASVGLTLMGSGVFGWPVDEVARITAAAIVDYISRATPSTLTRVVLFDMDPAKAAAMSQAMEANVCRPSETASHPAPPVPPRPMAGAELPLPPKPVPPQRPEYIWRWNDGLRDDALKGTGPWVPYDYDQCMQIEAGYQAYLRGDGVDNVHITGDRAGVFSVTKKVNPLTGKGEYYVYFGKGEDGGHYQENPNSGFKRKLERVSLQSDNDLPPLYADRYNEYRIKLQQWNAVNTERQAKAAASGASSSSAASWASGGGCDTPIGGGSDGTSQATNVPCALLHIVGFQPNVEQTRTELAAVIASGMTEVACATRIPSYMRLSDLRKDLADVLRDNNAQLLDSSNGVVGIRVRALGEALCHTIELKLQAAVLARSLDVVPRHWTHREASESSELALVELFSDSEEYQAVKSRVSRGVAFNFVKIERIENPNLYIRYITQQRLIAGENGGDPVIELLIHGTGTTDPITICGSNMGLYVNYSDGGKYGRATYLAIDTAYSDRGYVHVKPSGERQLLLVEAALGKIDVREQADSTMRHPKLGHHTVKGPVTTSHLAYMKYEPYHVYPTHLITYQHSAS